MTTKTLWTAFKPKKSLISSKTLTSRVKYEAKHIIIIIIKTEMDKVIKTFSSSIFCFEEKIFSVSQESEKNFEVLFLLKYVVLSIILR